jgi:hypothetical protein
MCPCEYSHLKVTEYLNSKNCPFNTNTINQTAAYGRLEMLKWLWQNKREDGCKGAICLTAGGVKDERTAKNIILFVWV